MNAIKVKISRRHADDLELPAYMTPGSAGLDLLARVDESVQINAGARAMISTGISVEIPSGYEAQVRPRSGLAARHGVTVLNSPGTIDSDYRGEIKVVLINHGTEPFIINRGDRIAQLIFSPVTRIEWDETESLVDTVRGDGGFGHTGMNS